MTVGIAHRSFWGLDLRLREAALPAALLIGSLVVYATLRYALIGVANGGPEGCVVFDLMAFAAACLCAGLRHDEVAAVLRPVLRGIAAVTLAQVVFDGSTLIYAPAEFHTGANGVFFIGGTVLAIGSGLLALWRPSFALPLLFHYVAFRHQLNHLTGVEVSETDYLSMLDIGEFAVIGGLFVAAVARARASGHMFGSLSPTDDIKDRAGMWILAWAIGAHLGNYFVSGWTKIQAGAGDPLFWLLHNPTQTSILIGLERGDNPLAAWPVLVQGSWNAIAGGGVVLNLFVLGLQILAPAAILRRRLLMAFVLLFDLFHIGVYLTLGAFFAFWIAVNCLIYMSAKRMKPGMLTPPVQAVTILAVLSAHFLFYTSHLGWLDGAKLASPSIEAVTRDGRAVPVPSVYFGILSYSIAQTAMYIPDGHFPMRLGGNTYNPTDWRDAQSCGADMKPHQDTGVSLATIKAMVQGTDAAMRRHPLVKAGDLFYFYPHHMVANPLMFAAFNRLSMDDIVGYRYVVESVCLGLRDGHLTRDVHKRSEFPIDAAR